jgi:peptidoglycan hydrolase-like protein with peptidoglycan-binding domain
VSRQLAFGTSGDDVRCLQHAINADRASDIAVTGYYGSQTRAAVRDFQAAVGLAVTGVLDAATAARYGIWGGGAIAAPAPAPAPVAGACVSRQLAFGTSGDDVRCLQHAINADRASDIAVTGYYGSQTRAAVRDFQAAVGLAVTGVLDAATAARYGIWGGGAVAAPAPAPAPVAGASGLPANSGSGRRVVYHRGQQRIWAVEADGTVVKSHAVSGRRFEPYAGTYRVYSRSMYTYSTADPNIKWRYMVRFAYGPGGGRIGFHEIPTKFGAPLQSERQLGQPLSGGCVRQSTADAIWMWNWAGVGTTVVVI